MKQTSLQEVTILGRVADLLITEFIPFYEVIVPAGFPSPALDYREEGIDLNKLFIKDKEASFMVRVKGESMKDAGIPHECLVLVDKSKEVKSGMVVIAWVDGAHTCKFFFREEGSVILVPANPAFPEILINESHNFSVFGPVVQIFAHPPKYPHVRPGRL